MDLLSPDITYFLRAILNLVNLVLMAISLWMLFTSKNLKFNIGFAIFIASIFIPILGPAISINLLQKHKKHVAKLKTQY